MKHVEITHGEVIPFYGTSDIFREVKVKDDKGTILNFNIKTRVNDRVSNSPVIFQKCSYFSNSLEKINNVKGLLKPGTVLTLKGDENRSSYIDKKSGTKKYSDELRVLEINPISDGIQEQSSHSNDLPF